MTYDTGDITASFWSPFKTLINQEAEELSWRYGSNRSFLHQKQVGVQHQVVLQICSQNTERVEAVGSGLQGQRQLHQKFKVSMDCMKPCPEKSN